MRTSAIWHCGYPMQEWLGCSVARQAPSKSGVVRLEWQHLEVRFKDLVVGRQVVEFGILGEPAGRHRPFVEFPVFERECGQHRWEKRFLVGPLQDRLGAAGYRRFRLSAQNFIYDVGVLKDGVEQAAIPLACATMPFEVLGAPAASLLDGRLNVLGCDVVDESFELDYQSVTAAGEWC